MRLIRATRLLGRTLGGRLAAEWPLLAQTLGLGYRDQWTRQHRFPAAEVVVDDQGVTATVAAMAGAGLADYQRAAGYLADTWGGVTVRAEQQGPGLIRLRGLHRDPLLAPARIDLPGTAPASLASWWLGWSEDGSLVMVRLAEVQRLEALGASRYDHQQERGFDFWVMRDPWGNELCVLQPNFPELARPTATMACLVPTVHGRAAPPLSRTSHSLIPTRGSLRPACPPIVRRPGTLMNDSWEGRLTVQPSEITEVLHRPISQELLARDLTRLAYVAKDGTPRSIPIGFTWNGSAIVMCTAKNAAKLAALRHNPAVALTIDTEVHPPTILLIRGRAELDVVEGIPDEYLEMNGSYTMTPEQRVEWEAEVRSLYDGMVRIVVVPRWVKLIDFETTLPSAVAELARQRDERQRA